MKKRIPSVLSLLGGAFAVHAQGTVSLANYGALSPYIYASYYAIGGVTEYLGGSSVGPAATLGDYAAEVQNGNDWTVELYGTVANALNLEPLGVTATLANGISDPVAGTWATTAYAQVPGTIGAGSIATVQLYLWYNDGGVITSYPQALADGVPTAVSAIANVVLGGPSESGPPVTATSLPSLALGNLTIEPIPEPPTFALSAIVGGLTLLRYSLRRR